MHEVASENAMKRNLVSFDYAIKYVLRDKANFGVLSGLLTELLGTQIVVQELLESESNKDAADDKSNRLDIKAKMKDGSVAIIEVQVNLQHDYFQRVLYGLSKAVVEQLHSGDPYGDIKKVYSINVVYFQFGVETDYIYHGTMAFEGVHDRNALLLPPQARKYLSPHLRHPGEPTASKLFPEVYLIYPNRFDDVIKQRFDEWVFLLKHSEIDPSFSAAGIQAAATALDVLKMTKAEQERYDAHVKARTVSRSELESSKAEGKAEGIAEGIAEGKAEIARKMKCQGMDTLTIVTLTDLTVEEILAL
jgi:hypothetical protein